MFKESRSRCSMTSDDVHPEALTLSQDEVDELTAYYDECKLNILKAARGGCVATAGTFIREARYIKNILDRK